MGSLDLQTSVGMPKAYVIIIIIILIMTSHRNQYRNYFSKFNLFSSEIELTPSPAYGQVLIGSLSIANTSEASTLKNDDTHTYENLDEYQTSLDDNSEYYTPLDAPHKQYENVGQ